MKLRILLFGLISVCFLVTSCSSNLSRGKAEALIRSKFTFPQNGRVEEYYLYWGGFCFQHRVAGPCGPDAMDVGVKALLSSGLITVTYEGSSSRIALTEKGKQYAIGTPSVGSGNDGNGVTTTLWKVKVVKTTLDFGTITGITEAEGSKSAMVEYTVIVKPTPFGAAYGLAPETVKEKAEFTKYDDGWRIKQ